MSHENDHCSVYSSFATHFISVPQILILYHRHVPKIILLIAFQVPFSTFSNIIFILNQILFFCRGLSNLRSPLVEFLVDCIGQSRDSILDP